VRMGREGGVRTDGPRVCSSLNELPAIASPCFLLDRPARRRQQQRILGGEGETDRVGKEPRATGPPGSNRPAAVPAAGTHRNGRSGGRGGGGNGGEERKVVDSWWGRSGGIDWGG
jgi:hypothetical protein